MFMITRYMIVWQGMETESFYSHQCALHSKQFDIVQYTQNNVLLQSPESLVTKHISSKNEKHV